jgi:hypothetical protein
MEFMQTPKEENPMKSALARVLAVAGLVSVFALPVVAEDLTIVSTVKVGSQPTQSTQYLTADRTRTNGAERDSMVEYGPGRIVMIDNKKREYTEATFDEMAAMFQKMDAEFQKMPAFLQKTMGAAVGDVTVRKGTAPRTIAGYECTQYTLAMGEDMVFDIWAAPSLQVPVRYVEAMKAPFAAMGPMGRRFAKMYDEMKKVQGFPLSFGMRYKVMGKQIEVLTEAIEVKKGPIPASVFAIPVGYAKKDSFFKQK